MNLTGNHGRQLKRRNHGRRAAQRGAGKLTERFTNHLHPALWECMKLCFSSTQIPLYSTPEAIVSVVSRKDDPKGIHALISEAHLVP